MIQKYISVIKLKKQTVTGATELLQITTIYLYVNTDAMVQSLKLLYTKRENQIPACRRATRQKNKPESADELIQLSLFFKAYQA